MLISRFLFVSLAVSALAAAPDGEALYKARCSGCHDGKPQPRMPSREELTAKTPEFVYVTMAQGVMGVQAAGLSEDEQRAIARYVTGKEFSTAAPKMSGQCTTPAPALKMTDGDWSGWGIDPGNSHFQTKPGLSAADVPKLKLKWAFGFPNDPMAFSQPAVAGGRLFVGSVAGNVYSLNASTGCIYWTYNAGAGVRTAISVGKLPNGKWAAYFGDIKATAHAVDAETGALLWKIKLDEHPAARITGAPILVNGRVYVPMSSIEEASAAQANYSCCTFRGSISSIDAATGKKIWQSYSVPDPAKPYKTSKNGTELKGPAGASIWSSPTVDLKRKLVYAATGNSYTSISINTSDAVLAFDLETGRLVWSSQVQPKDNFVIGCPRGAQCDPDDDGPDFDFGTSPVLRHLSNGKDILVAGQKAGVAWGLDPDDRGKVVWQTRLGKGSALGGIEWGHAADDQLAYVAISDRINGKQGTPGLYALDLATGQQKWGTPAPAGIPGNPAQSAAVAVIPGVVFSGALNGHFRAYSTTDGAIIWDFDTNRPFDTVNQVEKAKGGSIDAPGPVISHGIVYTNSGYGIFGGVAGNVLLAFSIDGK
jgi:polyvinyl alcohol dehydrogenase (cytochrome)